MNVIVFGATGRLGPYLLEKLLRDKHGVAVFARAPSKVKLRHLALTVMAGDATDAHAVAEAVTGRDAVVNAVGGDYAPNAGIRLAAVTHIIAGMKRAGIKRIVNLGGMGILPVAGVPMYRLPMFPKDMVPVTREHQNVYQALRDSGLEWTMVCPSFMTPGPYTGAYKTRANRPFLFGKREIPLADVADFVATELARDRYRRQLVAIVPQRRE